MSLNHKRLASLHVLAGLLVASLGACAPLTSRDTRQVTVKVIYAHSGLPHVDPGLRLLVKDLGRLNYSAYQLRDEAIFNLEADSASRLQLPNSAWLSLTAHDLTEGGRLRLEIEVVEMEFQTSVALASGATLVVGGAPYAEGSLLVAITRVD